jgi:aspartoacylase
MNGSTRTQNPEPRATSSALLLLSLPRLASAPRLQFSSPASPRAQQPGEPATERESARARPKNQHQMIDDDELLIRKVAFGPNLDFRTFMQELRLRSMIENESYQSTSRWDKNCISKVQNVAVVGGTHGNELHGIYLCRELQMMKNDYLQSLYPSLALNFLIGNPEAVRAIGTGAGRRYCDVDLNRCFLIKDLADNSIQTVEGIRAKELDALLGPKSSPEPATDFIFDIHSTTSNTGILLCFHPRDKFAWQVAAYLQNLHPDISCSLWSDEEVPLLPSIARSGLTLEVGPIAHSTGNSALYQRTKKILLDGLAYIEMHNKWISRDANTGVNDLQKSVNLVLFERWASVGYPRDREGFISALVHPSLQGAPELQGGTTVQINSPVFQTLRDGTDILYGGAHAVQNAECVYRIELAGTVKSMFTSEVTSTAPAHASSSSDSSVDPGVGTGASADTGNENKTASMSLSSSDGPWYPMFINEAAYNEKDIAFVLMTRKEVKVSVVTVQ